MSFFNLEQIGTTTPKWDPLKVECPPTTNIETAEVAMIGEAPSTVELQNQEPFSGPTKSIMNRLFSTIRLPRYKVYMTNACKAKLPKNDAHYLISANGQKCSAFGQLQKRLIDELSGFKGTFIVPLGSTAMQVLLDQPGMTSINKYAGSIYRAEDFPHLAKPLAGKLICPTFHPSSTAMNRTPLNFYYMVAHMLKMLALADQPDLLNMPVELLTRPLYNDVICFLHECNKADLVGFDIEATPQFVTCLSMAYDQDGLIRSMCIPFMSNSGAYWTLDEEVEIWDALQLVLSNPQVRKIAQNGMFDFMFILRKNHIITDNFYFDTMLAQHICYPDLRKGLDILTALYTYFPYYKDDGKEAHLKLIKDWPKYWEYNAKDSAYLLPITKRLIQEANSLDALPSIQVAMQLHKPLMEMEFNGMWVNRIGLEQMKVKYAKYIKVLQAALNKMVGHELSPSKNAQMKSYFYDELNIVPYINRTTGRPTCDATALARIAKKGLRGSAEAKIIMKIRKLSKLLSTYFTVPLDPDDHLRCHHNISGTSSGRISTEATFFGTGMNLQNQPPLVKRFLGPNRDRFMVVFDLAKAEAHIVAYISQDEAMINAFLSGIDIHTLNASKIFNVPMEAVTKYQRALGKRIRHAGNYRIGAQTLSDQLAAAGTFLPQGECRKFLLADAARFPAVGRWQRQVEQTVYKTKILHNLFGRPKQFIGPITDKVIQSAISFIPQSTVAELLNRGLIKIANHSELDRKHYDIDLNVTVHDSVGYSMLYDKADDLGEVLKITRECLTHEFTYLGRTFTIGMDAKVCPMWGGQNYEIKSFDDDTVNGAIDFIKQFKR